MQNVDRERLVIYLLVAIVCVPLTAKHGEEEATNKSFSAVDKLKRFH